MGCDDELRSVVCHSVHVLQQSQLPLCRERGFGFVHKIETLSRVGQENLQKTFAMRHLVQTGHVAISATVFTSLCRQREKTFRTQEEARWADRILPVYRHRLDEIRRVIVCAETVVARAVQSAYARKRNGWKIDRKDHSALDHHKWIEKQTDTASGAAYRQMNKRLERAQRTLDSLTVAAKRYDGDIWIDIRPSNRKELLHLTEGIIIFGSGRMTSSNDAARTPTQSILHADGHQWKVAHNPGMSGEKPRMPGVAIPKLSIGQQDHIGLTGANGLGKTTVMNALLDSMPEDLPHLIVQQQTGEAALSQTMRRLAALQGKERSQVLAAFAQLNADPDKLLSNEAPSPGELRKLMLCLGILDRPQLIVMDEPTNYLDLESKVALARCLADYPGALVVASHDEWFLDQVVR